MRKIQFRGKNLKGEWVYGSLIKGETTHEKHPEGLTIAFIVPGLPCASEPHDLWTAKMQRVDPLTVGQYIGLEDKNGKAIYEGDIITSISSPFTSAGDSNYLGVVACDTDDTIGEFYAMLFVREDSTARGIINFTSHSFYDIKDAEVIGNIFDNKRMFRDSDDDIMKWYQS